MSRLVVPDLFIAAFYVEAGMSKPSNLYGQGNNIELADKTLGKILCKGTAETHMHFNAGMEYNYLWQKMMDLRIWNAAVESEKSYNKFSQKCNIGIESVIFRILCADYIENASEKYRDFQSYITACNSYGIENVMNKMTEGEEIIWITEFRQMYKVLRYIGMAQNLYDEEDNDYLFATIYRPYRYCRTSSELIFLFRCLSFLKQNGNDLWLMRLFLQYLRRKNGYFSEIIQTNNIQGLANFTLYYRQMGQKQKAVLKMDERQETILRNISLSVLHLKKLEIRIALDMYGGAVLSDSVRNILKQEIKSAILECVKKILLAYQKNMREAMNIWDNEQKVTKEKLKCLDELCNSGKAMFPTLGIIIHFIKRNAVENRIGDMCWVRNAEEKGNSDHILVLREKMVLWAEMIEELRSSIPLLGKYIVGIDAASEENNAEPWIFAPVYTAIRNKRLTRPLVQDQNGAVFRVNNIGFTYHVGEEFRHFLSGLRHIDEVVEHFFYKSGDRLGHAIVLGINVKEWIERNDVITIPVIEQMENLLWLWGNMVYRNWVIEIATEVLEGKILSYAKMIYAEINGMTVHMLYDAYIEKFQYNYKNSFRKEKLYIQDETEAQNVGENGVGHFCKYYSLKKSPYGVLWTKEKIFCTFFCPLYYAKMQRPIFINVDEEELTVLQKAQQYVLREVEQKGIYIETNPTSNLSIGEGQELYDQHILRLNSSDLVSTDKDKREALITVNSDDPIIFNTNTENELAYMYYALVYKGYAKERVLRWIDKVRQMGMDSSFVKEEISASQQYREIEQLLKEIEWWHISLK